MLCSPIVIKKGAKYIIQRTLCHHHTFIPHQRMLSSETSSINNNPAKKKTVKKAPLSQSLSMGNTRPVEEIYQKKTQLEHILLRPDTYIGSIERQSQGMWTYDPITESMQQKQISFVPGLFKIFDEILVNAADNKIRDASMDVLKVDIDRVENVISIYNNGKGIPIEMHSKEGVYVPELIFG